MISIHALRGEGDVRLYCECVSKCYFNPRPPWGGRPAQTAFLSSTACISIHALRGEGDDDDSVISVVATISIHALRGEGDLESIIKSPARPDFNPRPPWGGRLHYPHSSILSFLFQSTPSVGRATLSHFPKLLFDIFQSTPSVGRATQGYQRGIRSY